jgi:hypothetical protein
MRFYTLPHNFTSLKLIIYFNSPLFQASKGTALLALGPAFVGAPLSARSAKCPPTTGRAMNSGTPAIAAKLAEYH